MTTEERFWARVVKTDDGCWGWTGSRSGSKAMYPVIAVDRRNAYAHRFSYVLHHGPIPDGMVVMHKCDNPPCTNPDHLVLGTPQDNIDDKVAKGRQQHSERAGGAIHTSDLIRTIRAMSKTHRQCDIAAALGVSRPMVCSVLKGRIWRHVQ